MVKLSIFFLLLLAQTVSASTRPAGTTLQKLLLADLKARSSRSFDGILKQWEHQYGTNAVDPLLSIAVNKKHADADRYVALMGVARLGGRGVAPQLTGFLKDPSWMLRSGSLRALSALKDENTSTAVLPLLKDKALVVRLEAVQAAEKLRPSGTAQALAVAANDPANFHAGRAQWVPQRALAALVSMEAREAAPLLRPLLERNSDQDILQQTILALEVMTGKKLEPGKPLPNQVAAWKLELIRLAKK
jgi:HEAT repeat protein